MPVISLNSLSEGHITEADYYTLKGQLLIAKGEVLTKKHFDLLRRRNIFEINLQYNDFDEQDESTPATETDQGAGSESTIQNFDNWNIKSGQDGYKQLLSNKALGSLDRAIKFERITDAPVGRALRSAMQQSIRLHRSETYKNRIVRTYDDALHATGTILNKLANGSSIDAGVLRGVVEQFIELFINDRNIMLALASQKIGYSDPLYNHALNVCLLSMNIAASANYSEEQVILIGMGALLHDVGMLLVPKSIRFKKGRLNEEEWYEIRKHPLLGIHIIDRLIRLPDAVKYITYQTHERENGKGYPKQRPGRLIHNFAKIAQVADVFEAVSAPRPYRQAFAPYKGMEMLIKMGKQKLLNEHYVTQMLKSTSLFPVGSFVQLSDGRIAQVIAANEYRLARPLVSIVVEPNSPPLIGSDIYSLDLALEPSIQVVKSLPFDQFGFNIMHGF